MPIPLGVLAVAGAGAPVANAYELLETEILAGTAASVTFSNLNSTYGSTYQHLQLRIVGRSSGQSGTGYAASYIRINNDSTTANYKNHLLYGDGSSTGSSTWTITSDGFRYADISGSSSTADAFTPVIVDILDPFETTKNTTFRSFNGNTNAPIVMLSSAAWFDTAAVDEIRLVTVSNFVAGSRFSLYGLRSA